MLQLHLVFVLFRSFFVFSQFSPGFVSLYLSSEVTLCFQCVFDPFSPHFRIKCVKEGIVCWARYKKCKQCTISYICFRLVLGCIDVSDSETSMKRRHDLVPVAINICGRSSHSYYSVRIHVSRPTYVFSQASFYGVDR